MELLGQRKDIAGEVSLVFKGKLRRNGPLFEHVQRVKRETGESVTFGLLSTRHIILNFVPKIGHERMLS